MLVVPSTIGPPSTITIVFKAPVFSGDLTEVSAVNANMRRQDGTTQNLEFVIVSAMPYELVAQYEFEGGEITGTGAYALAPVLTVPGGMMPSTSVAMFVASPWATRPQLEDVSWVAVTGVIPPSTTTGAFTTTTEDFEQPASGATVTVDVKSSVWMAIGQPLFGEIGGAYTVVSFPNTTSVVLRNTGAVGNATPSTTVPSGSKVTAGGSVGPQGPSGAFGNLTKVASGGTGALAQAGAQRVALATDGGSAATALFPPVPNDGDAVWVKTTGATVAHQGALNPNGKNIEDPLNPGGSTSSPVLMGPNPGAGAVFVYEAVGTIWRQWL